MLHIIDYFAFIFFCLGVYLRRSRTSSGAVGVVGSNCLVIKDQTGVRTADCSEPVDAQQKRKQYSSISVVKEIAFRTVLPYVIACGRENASSYSTSLIRGKFIVLHRRIEFIFVFLQVGVALNHGYR